MAARVVTRLYDEALQPSGIGVNQFAILRWLRAEPRSVSDLASLLEMDRTTLTRDVSLLERRGLLTVDIDPQDRRRRMLSVSEAGRVILLDATPRWKALQARMNDTCGSSELAELIADLSALTAAARTVEPASPPARSQPK